MTLVFLLLAALLTALAMAFVLLPLLRGHRVKGADPRRAALQRAHAEGVLSDAELAAKLAPLPDATPDAAAPVAPARASAVVLAVLLPAATVALYLLYGAPDALRPGAGARATGPAAASVDGNGAEAAPPSLEQAAAGLAERMRESPDDLGGWMLLGRAYKNLQRFEAARDALANAYRLAPQDPDVMVEYAEALTLAGDTRRIEGEAARLLDAALALRPDHQRALWLKGIQAYQDGRFADAAGTWERLRDALPADADVRTSLQERIDEARRQAGGGAATTARATPDEPAATPSPPAVAPPARLVVQVNVAPALKSRIAASDTLFVFARAPEGPRMPVAIQRLPAASLPATVTLDDSTSMLPQLTLSTLPRVVVGARVSKSGQATPQPGDLEVLSAPLATASTAPVVLTIDRVVE